MRRVLLACDATPDGGIGHLVRCVALAEAASARGWEVELAGRIEVELARRMAAGVTLLDVPLPEDGPALAALARERGADLVHVDDYRLPTDLHAAVASGGGDGVLLGSTEDGAWGRRPADVVVDSTLGADARPADGSGEVLLGVRYAPLRHEVLDARRQRAARAWPAGAPRVLVVLGGTDAAGAVADVVAAVARVVRGTGVGGSGADTVAEVAGLTVVAPPARHAAVRAAAAALTGPQGSSVPTGREVSALPVEVLGPQAHLPAVAAAHDVVLTAAGTTVWELACVGVATGLVAVVDNQRAGYARAVRAGIAVGLGDLDELRRGDGDAALAGLLRPGAAQVVGARGAALVDGRGAERVVQAWERTLAGVRVRPATAGDAALLRAWRNDPVVRASSRSTAEVDAGAHAAWLARVLDDPDRLLLVAERHGEPVGTVRLDDEGDVWEVSITLDGSVRGHGLAPHVLSAAEEEWARRTGGAAPLLACVRPGNDASARLFTRAGYRPVPERGDATVDAYLKP